MIPAAPPQIVDVPAHLGWRLLAQIVDLSIVVFVFGIVISIFMASGVDIEREIEQGWLIQVTFFALVFCYFLVFEGLLSATPGKMAAGLRVTMRDGSRVTGVAAVVRNLVRVPELMFWYIPSVISVAASPERRRLGDFAARTMVWRRLQAPQAGPPPPPGWQGQVGAPQPGPLVDRTVLGADACLTAARNLGNAENAYRLMAEREHLRLVQFGLTDAGADALSDEYVSVWDTFAEAVVGLQHSYLRLVEVLAGQDVAAFVTARPPFAAALRAVEEYLPAASDDDVVAIFRRRLEAPHPPGV